MILNNNFVCTQLNGFKYSKWLNGSICSTHGTPKGTTTLSQSEPGSNENEEVLHIPQSSRTRASSSDGLVSYQGYSLWGGTYCCIIVKKDNNADVWKYNLLLFFFFYHPKYTYR